MLGTDARFSFREMSVLQVCLWRDWTLLPTNSADCLLGERFKVKMGLPEWYTNDAVAQYLIQWVIFPFLSVRTEYLALLVSLQWWIQGRGPGRPPPALLLDQTEAKGPKKHFCRRVPPLPYLRVWVTAPPPLISRSGSGSSLINWKLFVLLLNTRQCICVHLDSNKDKYNLLV